MITCPLGGYREVLSSAVERIDLAALEIGGMKARKAVTGAQVYEIGGPDRERKADALASRLREVVGQQEGVRISRPTMTAEIRIRERLDESIESADIAKAVTMVGGCCLVVIRAGEVSTTGKSPGTAWVRCPVAAANKLVAAKKIRVSWIQARVEALEKRPLRCFKCHGKVHMAA